MNGNANSAAIITFCSHLCVGDKVKPLEPSEWTRLASTLYRSNLQPKELLNFTMNDFANCLALDSEYSERLSRLVDRSSSIFFEVEKYESMGVKIVTRSDADYPKRLKEILKNNCPPLFYYTGDLSSINGYFTGFVGSRDVNQDDITFTQKIVDSVIARGFSIVSGGAKGIDSISREVALKDGILVIEYISDSLVKRIKNKDTISAIKSGKLILMSVAKPDAGFNTGIAMMRNKYIYAQSIGTIIVKSDYKKGGTWAGAMENLRNRWCCAFCWDNASYIGNSALIENGAIPIDENWNADITSYNHPENSSDIQLSLFSN